MASLWPVVLTGACAGCLLYGVLRGQGPSARMNRKLKARLRMLSASGASTEDLGGLMRNSPSTHAWWLRQLLAVLPQLAVWEQRLSQAELPWSLSGLTGLAGLLTAAAGLGLLFYGAPGWLVLAAAVAAGCLPFAWISQRCRRLAGRFDQQLPDALELISRSLHAGMTLPATLGMVGNEFAAPLGPRFRQLSDELGHGASFGEALSHLAASAPSATLRFFISAVAVQREVGGNLAELTENAATVIRQRLYLDDKVKSLTAEGRLSALVLTTLPGAMLAYLYVVNRDYVSVFWTDDTGRLIFYVVIALVAFGNLVMRRMIRIHY